MKRKLIYPVLAMLSGLLLAACGNVQKGKENRSEEDGLALPDSLKAALMKQQADSIEALKARLPEEPVFQIVTDKGTIKVRLYGRTPKHRDNFVKLALLGYYDGLLFHRVIDGFMIQTGDPLTRDPEQVKMYGTGGPGYTLPAEFVPEYRHVKGALAAARRGDAANPKKESSGSQFYIVQDEKACAPLDGSYTVFGETIEGLEVIDAIAKVPTNPRDLPLEAVRILSVTPDPACLAAPPAAEEGDAQ